MVKEILVTVVASLFMPALAFAEGNHGSSHSADHSSGHSGAHWSYDGNSGPEMWDNLGYSTCGIGKNQSPVDISKSAAVELDDIAFHYASTPVNMVNNGHTVQFNYGPGSSIDIGGVNYELLQFHFHTPSENTIDGQSYPMEMHLVHKSKEGKLAVVGVFIKVRDGNSRSSGNDAVDTVFRTMAERGNGKDVINASDLLPSSRNYFHFMGSLTTPPCSEGVAWFVMREPIEMSHEQLATFKKLYEHNARPVQPQNRRIIFTAMSTAHSH